MAKGRQATNIPFNINAKCQRLRGLSGALTHEAKGRSRVALLRVKASRIIDFLRRIISMRVVRKALTFDDVSLVPAHSRVLPREVILKTRLTRTIELNLPVVSAAMDTVTESRLAIALAQEGAIGILHKNMPPAAQAA